MVRVLAELIFQTDAFRLGMHGHQFLLLLDEGLDDVVGDLVRHLGVGNQDVLHHRDRVVLRLAGIGLRGDDAARIDAAVFGFMFSTTSAWSIIAIFTPGVAPRSVTAAVGSPPTQKNASIRRSLSALTDSATPRRSRRMSLSRSRPAPSITRNAITSVALPGEPVDTRLPFRLAMLVTPVPSTDTTCMRLG